MPRSYADFARPSYAEPRWLETQWFSATTGGDHPMRLHFWTGFRTNLGVAVTKVYAFSTIGTSVLDMDLCDMQYHQPIGSSRLSDFSLACGLTVRGRPAPDRYLLDFRSRCGRLTAELDLTALMAPVDLEVTRLESAGPGFTAFHRTAANGLPENRTGTEPVGHIDQTMVVTGEVVFEGERLPVDCVANRDHSWSPRAEYRHSAGTFDMVHFGKALTLLTHTGEHADGTPYVSNAYVLRDGELRRVATAEVEYERDGFRTVGLRYDVVDVEGDRYEILGRPRASAEIDGGQNIYLVMDLLDCTWAGRDGYGEVQWHDEITRLQGRRGARALSRVPR
jgi:hypothetical protein